MAICEDAPCCGCCGTNIYGVYQGDGGGSDYGDESDWYDDRDDFFGDEDDDEGDDEGDEYVGREDFGWAGDPALCGE